MSKDGENLKSFKISDLQKPGPGERKQASKEPAPQVSAGFPTIEGLLESQELDLSGLAVRREALEQLSAEGSAQSKGAAAKALAAYERTADLIEFLWETKHQLGQTKK